VLQNLDRDLKTMVFGQDQAIDALSAAIKLSRAGLREPEKPIGSYLFSGPTGGGKTEVAPEGVDRVLGALLALEGLQAQRLEQVDGVLVREVRQSLVPPALWDDEPRCPEGLAQGLGVVRRQRQHGLLGEPDPRHGRCSWGLRSPSTATCAARTASVMTSPRCVVSTRV